MRIIQSVLLQKSTPFLGFFDKEDTADTDDTTISSIGTRLAPINRAVEFTNICQDETHYIYPRRGTNKKGKYSLLYFLMLNYLMFRSKFVHS